MGLQNNLTDVSSDSVPILLLSIIATAVRYLRSLILPILHSLGILHQQSDDIDDSVLFNSVGSGFAGLILLADQLNINRVISHKYILCTDGPDPVDSDCVVCLNRLIAGEQVRRLPCHHVFHKDCFDGWLHLLNFNCPLCWFPLVSGERVAVTRRRMTDDAMSWFGFRL